jgi:hypothetical protein
MIDSTCLIALAQSGKMVSELSEMMADGQITPDEASKILARIHLMRNDLDSLANAAARIVVRNGVHV